MMDARNRGGGRVVNNGDVVWVVVGWFVRSNLDGVVVLLVVC